MLESGLDREAATLYMPAIVVLWMWLVLLVRRMEEQDERSGIKYRSMGVESP